MGKDVLMSIRPEWCPLKGEDWELMENDKLEMDTNEGKSKMMVCPFCGEKRICQLRFGQIADKKIPYYICLDCERMKI